MNRSLLAFLGLLALFAVLTTNALAADPAVPARPAENKPKTSKPWTMPPAPEGVIIEKDVAYLAADSAEKADLYLPAKRAADVRSPAVVIIHGGGWTGGDKAAAREFNIGTNLALNGYVAMSINYVPGEGRKQPGRKTCTIARPPSAGFARTPSDCRSMPTTSA